MAVAGTSSQPAAAQVPFDAATQVATVTFTFEEPADVDQADLLQSIATRGRGQTVGLRRALSWVPFVTPVENRRFDPVELQKDKERVRRHMSTAGYPRATVEYDVAERDGNALAVTFRITPGPPLLVRSRSVEWRDSLDRPDLSPAELLTDARPTIEVTPGERLDRRAVPPAEASVRRWLADQGHPFASVRARIDVDSTNADADLTFVVLSGPRRRIGRIDVREDTPLDSDRITELAGVSAGDWYSLDALQRASGRVAALDIVRDAAFEVAPEQPSSETVDLVFRVTSQEQHTIGGDVGYASDGGVAAEAQWSDRNIFGGGQTLTATLAGQSGWLSLDQNPERFVRGGLSLHQPLGRGRLSLLVGPFAELRDDYRDRSFQVGGQVTLVRRLGEVSSIALAYQISTRRVYEYKLADISTGLDFLELIETGAQGLLDEFGARLNRSIASLTLSLIQVDSPTDPTRGYSIEPTIAATVVPVLNSTQFVSMNVRAAAYMPLTPRVGLAARFGAGKLLPFGKSVPPTQDQGLREYFRLREDLMTGGGTSDVRGWEERLLGPKFPQVSLTAVDSTVVLDADGYAPLAGFNRIFGTLEARFPFGPAPDRLAGHVFVDTGRIWTHDERFTDPEDVYGISGLFWATGLGIDYETPVGSLRFSVGIKLNPTFMDLADADEALAALLSGEPQDSWSLDLHQLRRFRVHIGFGRIL